MRSLVAIVFVSLAAAQPAYLAAKLDHAASAFAKARNFTGSVLVAKGGTVVFEKGYGMANFELDVPNTPNTKFRLGSITKQFTSAAILQLQEQGKLSVTDSACKYVEGCPEAWQKVTIHQLLTHTSGIPSYTNLKDFPTPKFMRQPLTPVEVVMMTRDKPMDFEPGTRFNYDNTGYVMLGVILEKVSGEKYSDYLKKHIFTPLDMSDSGYDDTRALLKNRAAGYSPGPGGLRNADYLDMSLPHAAGSLYSTARDLYRWDRALYTEKVLSAKSKTAMWTPEKNNYGYGWTIAPVHGHKHVGHGGGINGFSTYIGRFPDDDAVVVVLSNNEAAGAQAVATALAAALFGVSVDLPGELKAIHLDSAVLDRYVGIYQVGPMQVTVTNENGHLMIEPKGQRKIEALPSAENVFFIEQVGANLTFTADSVTLKQGGATLTGKKQ